MTATKDQPPVRKCGDVDYVRVSEMPDRDRQVFEIKLRRGACRCPYVAELGNQQDAVYAEDYRAWRAKRVWSEASPTGKYSARRDGLVPMHANN